MKVAQLVALFGGTALAVSSVEISFTNVASTVVVVTSTSLFTEICTDIEICPPYTTTAETSVVYVTATTTICLLSSTPPGFGPPINTASPSSVASSAYPTGSMDISVSLAPGSSIPPVGSEYPTGSAPQTSALPISVSSTSAYAMPSSLSVVLPSGPYSSGVITITDVSPSPGLSSAMVVSPSTSTNGPSSVGSSSGDATLPGSSFASSYTNPAPVNPGSSTVSSMSYPGSAFPGSSVISPIINTDAVPTSLSTPPSGPSSDYSASPSPSGSEPSGPTARSSSNTDDVPTAPGATATGSLSSEYNVPSSSSAALSMSNTDAVPTSLTVPSPTGPASSVYDMPSSYSDSLSGPAGPSSSGYMVTSGSWTAPLSSNTDAVPTSVTASSPGISSTEPSWTRIFPLPESSGSPIISETDAVPTSLTASSSSISSTEPSWTGIFPLPESSGPPVVSETDAVPTSLLSGGPSAGPSSGNYFVPSGSSIEDAPTYTGEEPTSPTTTGFSGTVSSTYPGTLSATPGYPNPSPTIGPDSTVIDSTIRITSYQTQTLISYITAGPSSNGPADNPNTDTNTQAVPTIIPSGGASGSGYPYPSGGINGTIVAPFPSYIEVPINTGHIIGAGKSSLAAIVVALIFAHFA